MNKTRDPWFDNARWLAGSLVVTIHWLSGYITGGEPGGRANFAGWFHVATYPLRLPLFSILVGYFSPISPTSRDQRNLIRTVVIPLIVVTVLHVLLTAVFEHRVDYSPIHAEYTLWFLYAVIAWRVAAGYLWQLRTPLLVSVLLSLLAGAISVFGAFHLQLVLSLSPYFVLGLMLRRKSNPLRAQSRRKTVLAVATLATWFVVVTIFHANAWMSRSALSFTTTYPTDGWENLVSMGWRLAILLAVGSTACATLYLTPRRHIRVISYVGAGGFTIYLLHGLVLRLMRYNLDLFQNTSMAAVLAVIPASFLLALILGSKPVRQLTSPFLRPQASWLFKDSEAEAPLEPTGPQLR